MFSLETIAKLKENAEQYNYEPVGTWIGPIHYVSVVKPEDIQVCRAIFFFPIKKQLKMSIQQGLKSILLQYHLNKFSRMCFYF